VSLIKICGDPYFGIWPYTARQDKTLVTGHFDPLSVRSMNVSPPIRFAPGRIQRFLLFS